jgi:1-acyl-sn-glycerol-3-phosphate acyltransferase
MNLDTPCRPEPLMHAVEGFLSHIHVAHIPEIRDAVARVVEQAGPGALERLRGHLETAGSAWDYSPKDDLARQIHHVIAAHILREPPVLAGAEFLDIVGNDPVVIFANHVSYVDANAIEITLQQAGRHALADRLVAVAGPKVYSDLRRRFSSLCFGTIKVPQNTGRASGEAVMTPREVAAAARQSIGAARACLARGEALLVFPEGTRSRSGQMEPFLPGVARYLEDIEAWVLPVGLCGTGTLFPMGEGSFNPVPITVRLGAPQRAGDLLRQHADDRGAVMESIGRAVGALLPPEYRGVYA